MDVVAMGTDNIDSIVTVVVAVVSSGGLWTFMQFVVGRKSEAARQQAEQENRKSERATMLADAQAVAQQTALDSASKALSQVSERCDKCLDELGELRNAAESMIDTLEAFLDDDNAQTRLAVRSAIREMRRAI